MATQKSNITPWSYYSILFSGLLLIIFFFTSMDPGEKSIESEPVTLDELVLKSPSRPVIPQDPPVDIIIEDQITEYILTIDMSEAGRSASLAPEPTTTANNRNSRKNRGVKLHLTAYNTSYPVATPERPVLPAVIPVDIIMDDPIVGLMIPTGMEYISQVTPPRPTVPAEVPVDIILIDPIIGLDVNL